MELPQRINVRSHLSRTVLLSAAVRAAIASHCCGLGAEDSAKREAAAGSPALLGLCSRERQQREQPASQHGQQVRKSPHTQPSKFQQELKTDGIVTLHRKSPSLVQFLHLHSLSARNACSPGLESTEAFFCCPEQLYGLLQKFRVHR